MAISGLEGVVAATTRLSHVDGERGELVIAGYQVDELAEHATFEETTWLLWHGESAVRRRARSVPSRARRRARAFRTRRSRCSANAHRHRRIMDALRMAAGTLSLVSDERRESSRAFRRSSRPTGGCGGHTSRSRRARDLGHAANFLYMLSGELPDPERVTRARDLPQYRDRPRAQRLDVHGARHHVDRFRSRLGRRRRARSAQGTAARRRARAGPGHGVRDRRGVAGRGVLRRKIEAGEKLMGFGHRVYKVRDPQSRRPRRRPRNGCSRARGDMSLYMLARSVEAEALRLLEEYKPGRRLQTNVEFYTALLLHGLGSTSRCSRRPSRSAGSADGSRTRSSNDARTASSGRSRSTRVRATDNGCRSNSADPRVHAISKALRGAKPHP